MRGCSFVYLARPSKKKQKNCRSTWLGFKCMFHICVCECVWVVMVTVVEFSQTCSVLLDYELIHCFGRCQSAGNNGFSPRTNGLLSFRFHFCFLFLSSTYLFIYEWHGMTWAYARWWTFFYFFFFFTFIDKYFFFTIEYYFYSFIFYLFLLIYFFNFKNQFLHSLT